MLLLLTAFAGWPWVAHFLESGAAAWVQAIGSIGAIFVAFGVVQRQHAFEVRRRDKEDQAVQLGRAKSLRIIFFTAASVCEEAADSVINSSGIWDFRANSLIEVRSRLLAIDPLQVPGEDLLLIVENCSMKLRVAALLVGELKQPLDKETNDIIESVVRRAALECWLGFKEATNLETRLRTLHGVEEKPLPFDKLNLSRKELAELRDKALYLGEKKQVRSANLASPSTTNKVY